MEGAFQPGNPADFESRPVVLVDDVVTTGSTLLAAAERLRLSGALVVGALCLARTPRRNRRRAEGPRRIPRA